LRLIYLFALFLVLLGLAPLCAEDEPLFTPDMFPCTYFTYVGPEIYYFQRSRKGGTEQSGRIDGIRFTIDRVKGAGIYLGGEILYSEGTIKGFNSRRKRLVSDVTDLIGEGRVGFTFMIPFGKFPFIIPYAGYGYFNEKNQFLNPSPLLYTTVDTFNYVAAGFLSGLNLTPCLSMGINIKARFMLNGRSKITEDPDFDDTVLRMSDESHYRVEVPFAYTLAGSCLRLEAILSPFFEYRHFGGKEGYPFNFIDTKFYLLGTTVALGLRY